MKAGKKSAGPPADAPEIAIPYPPGYSSRIEEIPRERPHFSPREKQVGAYLAEGFSDGEIADKVDLGLHGVKAHVKELLRKTDSRGRTQLQAWIWRDRMACELARRASTKPVKYS